MGAECGMRMKERERHAAQGRLPCPEHCQLAPQSQRVDRVGEPRPIRAVFVEALGGDVAPVVQDLVDERAQLGAGLAARLGLGVLTRQRGARPEAEHPRRALVERDLLDGLAREGEPLPQLSE